MKKNWPKIRQRGAAWQVDLGVVKGRRVQKSFPTRAKAEEYAAEKRKDFALLGKYGSLLTDDLKIQAVKAALVVKDRARLEDLALEWAMRKGQGPDVEALRISEIYSRFMTAKERANLRPSSLGSYRTRVGRFVKQFGHLPADSVTAPELEQWLDTCNILGESRKGFLVSISVFYNWARRRNYATRNPADIIERPRMDTKTPNILNAGEVESVLRAAQDIAPEMVPFFALAFFSGMRTKEIVRMRGMSIDEDEGHITVTTDMAKNRSVGYVQLEPNLKAWLHAYPVIDRVFFSRRLRRKVIAKAKVNWKTHIARKTYASHHYALYRDPRITAHNLRQQGMDLLFERYRGLVTHREAKAYFAIQPESKVLDIKKQAG